MVHIVNVPDCPRAVRYREQEKAEVKKGEESVQCVLAAVRNFSNPFTEEDPEKNRLYTLAFCAPVPMEVEMDVLRAEALG